MKIKVLQMSINELLKLLYSRDKFERIGGEDLPEDSQIILVMQDTYNPLILRLVIQSESFPDFNSEERDDHIPVLDSLCYQKISSLSWEF